MQKSIETTMSLISSTPWGLERSLRCLFIKMWAVSCFKYFFQFSKILLTAKYDIKSGPEKSKQTFVPRGELHKL